jgi:hypothetical protein
LFPSSDSSDDPDALPVISPDGSSTSPTLAPGEGNGTEEQTESTPSWRQVRAAWFAQDQVALSHTPGQGDSSDVRFDDSAVAANPAAALVGLAVVFGSYWRGRAAEVDAQERKWLQR